MKLDYYQYSIPKKSKISKNFGNSFESSGNHAETIRPVLMISINAVANFREHDIGI